MTRHGLTAPPLVPGGGGSPPHHGRPPPVAIAVDRRSAGGLCLWIEGPDLDFRFSRQGATNNTTTSLDDVDVELVPGSCDIVGHRASGGDVWACDVAAGDPQNTQQSIGGRRYNPPPARWASVLAAAVEGHRRWPQGIPEQSACGAGTWERGEA